MKGIAMSMNGDMVSRNIDESIGLRPLRRRAVLVLGMHRSGTSALAGLCVHLGWEMPGELWPSGFDNPKGFFENVAYVRFNERALARIGSTYDEPMALTSEQLQTLRELGAIEELVDILHGELGNAPLTVLKDPRMCRLTPLWIEALERTGREVATLHALRDPFEVAGSLTKRNGFSQTQGLLMWLDHVTSAERASRDRPRSFVLYDDLLRDWRTTASRVSEHLGIPWPIPVARAGADVDAFVTTDLRHSQSRLDPDAIGTPLQELAKHGWNAMRTLAETRDTAAIERELDDIRAQIEPAETMFAGYVANTQRVLGEREKKIISLEQHSTRMDEIESRLRTDLGILSEQLAASLQSNAEAHASHATLLETIHAEASAAVAAAHAEAAETLKNADEKASATIELVRAEAAAAVAAAHAEAAETSKNANEKASATIELVRAEAMSAGSANAKQFENVRTHLQSVAAEADAKAAHATMTSQAALMQIETIRNSVSWRLTLPLRVVGRAMPIRLRNSLGWLVRGLTNRTRYLTVMGAPGPTFASTGSESEANIIAERIDESPLFDESYYSGREAAVAEGISPALHYVLHGERSGLAPSQHFDPIYYSATSPDLIDVVPNLLLHYIEHGMAEGRKGFADSTKEYFTEENIIAERIEESPFFDESYYSGREAAVAEGISPALHYVLHGERSGLAPSQHFDPRYYSATSPDLIDVVPNLLLHYIEHGMAEGRKGFSDATREIHFTGLIRDPNQPTVLVITHEASRTGAPILAWNIINHLRIDYNVVTLLLAPGDLTADFSDISDILVGPLRIESRENHDDARYIVKRVLAEYEIDFVISNSTATFAYATAFSRQGIPVITLSHEFAAYMRPHGVLNEMFTLSDEVVFSAEMVLKQSEEEYPILIAREAHVVPQGQCFVPQPRANAEPHLAAFSQSGLQLRTADEFVVVGLGTVEFRKGVDLFVSSAAAAIRARPDLKFRFIWFGHRPDWLAEYASFVEVQIKANGLDDCFELRDPVPDLDPVYRQADVVALMSRLDPLPNISIDAAMLGIPVVCFAGASGFADIVASRPDTASLVVPHLDTTAAGNLFAELAADRELLSDLGCKLAGLAEQTFRMKEYVATLAELGRRAARRKLQKRNDLHAIRETGAFNAGFYKGMDFEKLGDDEAIALYLSQPHTAEAIARSDRDPELRSPMPGFHPLLFAHSYPEYDRSSKPDPLAEFLRLDRPDGPWKTPVISPVPSTGRSKRKAKVAIHGHFHYPELITDFLGALSVNTHPCDLFLTVTSEEGLQTVRKAIDKHGFNEATVDLVPNRGRDIGPFLTEFAEKARSYEIVGHFHGKRSVFLENRFSNYGNRWREFLWQHLIGADNPMADTIIDRMIDDPNLGLVFPADPHLVGWSTNRKIAETIAGQLGLSAPLPQFFYFPIGTMFWARSAALRPLFDLNLGWNDYPEEPVGEDGTLLHALERLFPHVATSQGFTLAVTHVPGILR